MLRIAYSTVACPEWTLERVAAAAAEYGFSGVELRSEGRGGTRFACEPGLTGGPKVRAIFHAEGVDIAGLASGVRFDAQVFPPVIGNVLPSRDASVREGKEMVALASEVGARYLRVYGFETQGRERHASAMKRICGRLAQVVDHARNRDVEVMIENGGSFPSVDDLVEMIERVNHPLLAALYDIGSGVQAGDDPARACAALGARLRAARVRDLRGDHPCMLGDGDLPVQAFVEAVSKTAAAWSSDPWLVFTWDRAWLTDLAPAERVLPEAARRLHLWSGRETNAFQPGPRSIVTV